MQVSSIGVCLHPICAEVDPRQQPCSHRAACCSPTLPSLSSKETEEEKKHRKVYGSGQRQLNRRKEAGRWHKGNHSPPSTSKPMPSQSPSSRHPGRQSALCPSSSASSLHGWAKHCMMWTIPQTNSGQLSQLCALPISCPPHAYSLEWGEGATTTIPVCYHDCFSHRSKMQHCTGCFHEI